MKPGEYIIVTKLRLNSNNKTSEIEVELGDSPSKLEALSFCRSKFKSKI